MRARILSIFTWVLLCAPFRAAQSQPSVDIDLKSVATHARGAVLLVTGFDQNGKPFKTGTGFFISAGGLIVTNWHVIDGVVSAEAKLENGATFKISGAVGFSEALDLAVIQADAREVAFLTIDKSDLPAPGTRIAVLGSPLALEGTLTDGIVSAVRTDDAGTWIQMTAPVSPGSSGSPVLNKDGQVIGIATLNSSGRNQSLNFARAARDLNKLLAGITADAKVQSFAKLHKTKTSALVADPDYVSAKSACDRKDFAGALKILNQLKQRFPASDPRLLILFGQAYGNLSLHEEALSAFREYVRVEPTDLEGWLGLATELKHFRALDDAAEAGSQAIKVAPDDERAWEKLGEIYIDGKNFQLAFETCRKATQLDPEDWKAWCGLGNALFFLGNASESKAAFKRMDELIKISTPPDSKNAKPIGRSSDSSVVKFDNGVLLFMKDKHIEWDAGGFRWRAYDGHWSEAEKIGPSAPVAAESKRKSDTNDGARP